jgi:membrane protease YdiL (CAAX protease family)
LLWIVTHGLIPAFALRSGIEPVLLWFFFGAFGVFVPLLVAAHLILRREAGTAGWSRERLRCHRLTPNDWRWTLGGIVAIGLLSALSVAALTMFFGTWHCIRPSCGWMPMTPDRYWILVVWLPFWILNIAAEESLWRGVVLPRQEIAFGRWAWLVNGAGWLLFHLAFGPTILLTLWPITFILPFIVQRTKNSWTGVLIHAALNGPAFVAIAFGFV